MSETTHNLLMKIAAQDKAPELIVNLHIANKMAKVAKTIAINEYTKDRMLHKQAELSEYLDQAWSGIKDWWSDDRNKTGLATGLATALGGYGLTSLLPGAGKNKLARLLMALGLGYGGYKAGQWGVDYFANKATPTLGKSLAKQKKDIAQGVAADVMAGEHPKRTAQGQSVLGSLSDMGVDISKPL